VEALKQFCFIAAEFLIEPAIAAEKAVLARGKNRNKIPAWIGLCVATPTLEFLHCMVRLL